MFTLTKAGIESPIAAAGPLTTATLPDGSHTVVASSSLEMVDLGNGQYLVAGTEDVGINAWPGLPQQTDSLLQVFGATGTAAGPAIRLAAAYQGQPTLAGTQGAAQIAASDDGSFIAVWDNASIPAVVDPPGPAEPYLTLVTDYSSYISVFSANGAQISQVAVPDSNWTGLIDVVELSGNNGYAVVFGGAAGITARRLDTLGNTIGSDTIVSSNSTADGIVATGLTLSTGAPGYVVGWWDAAQYWLPPGGNFHAQVFAADGARVGAEIVIPAQFTANLGEGWGTATSFADSGTVSIAALPDGKFVVAWSALNTSMYVGSGGESHNVWVQLFDDTGTALTSPVRANADMARYTNAAVTALPDGRFVVAYDKKNFQGASLGRVSQVFDVGGAPAALFGAGNDTVDFNVLSAKQQAAIAAGSNLYSSGAGADTVWLPDSRNMSAIKFSSTATFFGEDGDDGIIGGDSANKIDGGAGDDTIMGSPGADNLFGGDGADTFDFQAGRFGGFSGFAAGTKQSIDGGNQASGRQDSLLLPGSADDYTFKVTGAATWPASSVEIATKAGNKDGLPAGISLLTKDIEKVQFATGPANAVQLSGDHVAIEMLTLALEVYGPLKPLAHNAEPLNIAGSPALSDATRAARGRFWHAVSAVELGMRSADFSSGPLHYSFVDGLYSALGTSGSLFGDTSEANAMVLSGLVDNKRTLAVVFRGTDQLADFGDYLNFASHYAKYQPLMQALHDYVNAGQIDRILVSGHSLGAGMVQYFMREFPDTASLSVRAYTDGSPGSDEISAPATDDRILNFVNRDDPIPLVPDLTSPLGKLALGSIVTGMGLISPFAGAAGIIDGVLVTAKEKFRIGTDVIIDKSYGVSPNYSVEQGHSAVGYLSDVAALTQEASRSIPFSKSDLGKALQNDTPYTGPSGRIALGTDANDIITARPSHDLVLGSGGGDRIIGEELVSIIQPGLPHIDAGDGGDTLVLSGYSSTQFDWSPDPTGTSNDLIYKYDLLGLLDGRRMIARLYGIERLQFSDGVFDANGNKLVAQIALAGTQILTVDPSFGYTTAGDGDMIIKGSLSGDAIYAGKGNKTILAGGGDDTIILTAGSSSAPAAAINMIDGGAGADLMIADAGANTFVVDNVGDVVIGGNDVDTIWSSVNYRLGEDVEELFLKSNALQGVGNALANTITGNSGANSLTGEAGDDTLDGGKGTDTLIGGAGDDTYIVDNVKDAVVEQPDEGTDTVKSSVSHTLAGDVENLVLLGTAALKGAGNALANTITGNSGKNVLDGGAGDDKLVGGKGDDTYVVDSALDSVVEVDLEGIDTVQAGVTYTLSAYVEKLVLTGGGMIDGTGNGIDNLLTGNAFDNRLSGAAGNDKLVGGAGRDTLVGGTGDDTLDGGLGLDIADYADASSGVTVSLAKTTAQDTIGAGIDAIRNVEDLGGSIHGDKLTGSASANLLLGRAGDDVLSGGLGMDTLLGGADADAFLFESVLGKTNIDLIEDFLVGTDTIWLDDKIFAKLSGMTVLDAGSFVTGTAALDANDYILYDSLTGALFYDKDGNGSGAAAQFAILQGAPVIGASSFLVV